MTLIFNISCDKAVCVCVLFELPLLFDADDMHKMKSTVMNVNVSMTNVSIFFF